MTVSSGLGRGVFAVFQASLWAALVLAATSFGNLHRGGVTDLLLLVCLLLAFWAVVSLVAMPLRYVQSWSGVFLCGLLALLLLQVLPLPLDRFLAADTPSFGPSDALLADGLRAVPRSAFLAHGVGRYSLRPIATVGSLILAASAAGLFWLVASSLVGRKALRRATWAVILGVAPLALWTVLAALGSPTPGLGRSVFRPPGPLLILGGDSVVPALLAGLPLTLAVVLRHLGWMPRLPRRRRQHPAGWVVRAGPVWAAVALVMLGLMGAALGMSHVPWGVLATCVALSVGFALAGYVTSGPAGGRGRAVALALALVVWLAAAMGLGAWIGPGRHAASSADEGLQRLVAQLSADRAIFGLGGAATSPRHVFGTAGWPVEDGDDADTNGYLVLRTETGWVGLALTLGAASAMALFLLRAWRRTAGPWPRTVMRAGVGALAANLLYFRFDASALLAPNLLALASVLGMAAAWAAHGALWRPARQGEFRPAYWPMVVGALGLCAALALAETEMIATPPGHDVSDKVMHFGAFAVVSLLFCHALAPPPTTRRLAAAALAATAITSAVAVLVEYAQRYLTAGRSFEGMDIVAGCAGAALMSLWWWLVRHAHVAEEAAPAESPELPLA